jgi:hypothetical protein
MAAAVLSSMLGCRTQPAHDPGGRGPPPAEQIPVASIDTATVLRGPPLREQPARETGARSRFRDQNERDADIARGPVPGYAGAMIEGGCTFVVLLTDTLTQKAAAEAYFRSEVERRRPSGHSNCGGPYRLGFRQVRYDFAQLYDWYVGPFRGVWRERGLSMTDIDEGRNQLAVGVVDSAAYRRMLRLLDSLPIPKGLVRVHISRVCVGTGGPSVMVEVRDPKGRPAATGTTIVIQDGAFKDSVDGSRPRSDLHVGAGERRPGRYQVRLYKAGYKPVILQNVMAPGDEYCRYAEPTDVRKVTLELLPNAPKVRSIVVSPPGMGFGIPDDSLQLDAVVDADPDVTHDIRWTSSDTTVATVSATGVLRTKCRATTGDAVITATSMADPRVRGQASVTVLRPDVGGLAGPAARKAADCLERLRATPRGPSGR